MRSVLFLCHGNICRSPMAEYIFKDMAKGYAVHVESMAVSAEEVGNPIYPPARQVLLKHGICADAHRARKMQRSDYERFDRIIAMEKYNISRLNGIIGSDKDGKVSLLLDFTDKKGDIEDPWYSGHFESVYDQISRGCRGLLDCMTRNGEV